MYRNLYQPTEGWATAGSVMVNECGVRAVHVQINPKGKLKTDSVDVGKSTVRFIPYLSLHVSIKR